MGGFTVLPYAVAHPERVRALLMADTFLGIGDAVLIADLEVALTTGSRQRQRGR